MSYSLMIFIRINSCVLIVYISSSIYDEARLDLISFSLGLSSELLLFPRGLLDREPCNLPFTIVSIVLCTSSPIWQTQRTQSCTSHHHSRLLVIQFWLIT